MKPIIEIIVSEGCQYMRGGVIERLIKPQSELLLVGEAQSQQQVIELYDKFQPQLLLLALNRICTELPSRITAVKQHCQGLNILILTPCEDAPTVCATIRAGANGYVLSSEPITMILDAIHQVAQGKSWMSPSLGHLLATSQPSLGKRALEVLRL